MWILEILVQGFLLGDPVLRFEGRYRERFETETLCIEFRHGNKVRKEEINLIWIARSHLRDRAADIKVTFECVTEGEPA